MTVRILLNGIKLCKSNFYWVEFSDTQVEVRILLNDVTVFIKVINKQITRWSKRRPPHAEY